MNIPMRPKYVDEAVGVWFIFGEYADGDVDVSDGTRDVFMKIPRPLAERLIEDHAEFRRRLYGKLCGGLY